MSIKGHISSKSFPPSTLQSWNGTLSQLKQKLELEDFRKWQPRSDLHSLSNCTCTNLYSMQNFTDTIPLLDSSNTLLFDEANIESFQQSLPCLKFIGSFGVSCSSEDESQGSVCFLVQRLPDFTTVFSDTRSVEFSEPYVPGYLAFRHVDHFLAGLQRLRTYLSTSAEAELIYPQCLLVCGNGTLHEERFGLACHVGVRSGLPTIGVSKTLYNISTCSRDDQRSAFNSLSTDSDHLLIDESGRFLQPHSPEDIQKAIGAALKCASDYCIFLFTL